MTIAFENNILRETRLKFWNINLLIFNNLFKTIIYICLKLLIYISPLLIYISPLYFYFKLIKNKKEF